MRVTIETNTTSPSAVRRTDASARHEAADPSAPIADESVVTFAELEDEEQAATLPPDAAG